MTPTIAHAIQRDSINVALTPLLIRTGCGRALEETLCCAACLVGLLPMKHVSRVWCTRIQCR